jgi:hypothetical protein
MSLIEPLYPAGGLCSGFVCMIPLPNGKQPGDLLPRCGKVFRTLKGARIHLWTVHKIHQQMTFTTKECSIKQSREATGTSADIVKRSDTESAK